MRRNVFVPIFVRPWICVAVAASIWPLEAARIAGLI